MSVAPASLIHPASSSFTMSLRGAGEPSAGVSGADSPNLSFVSRNPRGSFSVVDDPTDPAIFSDIVLMCGHRPNWPRYIFFGEVKSGPLDVPARCQLIRQMMSAMISQSMVFGVLINSEGAWILTMKQDFQKKLLFVSKEFFDFLNRGAWTFRGRNFNAFFGKIVSLINYGFSHIKGIQH